MLRQITSFSIRNPAIVLVAAVVIASLCVGMAMRLPVDAFPDVSPTIVQVNVEAPQRSAAELERLVTMPLERALASTPHLAELRSLSRGGLTQATLVFDDGISLSAARQLVSERLAAFDPPEGVERPTLGPRTTALGEIVHIAISSDSMSMIDLRSAFDRDIAPRLARIDGVAEVVAWGGETPELRVTVDAVRAIAAGVTLAEVVQSAASASATVSTGAIRMGAGTASLSGDTVASGPADLVLAPVAGHGDLALTDIASIGVTRAARYGAATAGGTGEIVLALVFADVEANPYSVASEVEREVGAVAAAADQYSVDVVYSRRTLVDRVLHTAKRNLLEAGILVVVVLLFFLGGLRVGLLVAAAIPFAMLFAVGGLSFFGIAGTLLSLGAIDFGLVVDSSIVMTENVRRRLGEASPDANRQDVILDAIVEVRRPAIAGELVIACVYVPFLFMADVGGKLFAPMATTVLLALLGGAIFSISVVPALVGIAISKNASHHDWWSERVEPRWGVFLGRLFRRRGLVLIASAAVIGAGVAALMSSGIEFVPPLREGSVVVNVVRPATTPLDDAAAAASRIEALILERFPNDVAHIYTRSGTPDVATDPMGPEVSDVYIAFTDSLAAASPAELDAWIGELERVFLEVPGVAASISQPIALRTAELTSGARGGLVVRALGADGEAVSTTASRLTERLLALETAASVRPQIVGQLPTVVVTPDRWSMAQHATTATELATTIDAADGIAVGFARGPVFPMPIVVRLGAIEASEASVGAVPLLAEHSGALSISDVASVSTEFAPARIDRVDGLRQATIAVEWQDARGDELIDDVNAIIREPGMLAEGVWVSLGGTWEQIETTRRRLTVLLPLTLLLVLLIVYQSYGSMRSAARILVGIPFAISGGAIALWARDLPISLPAVVGLVAVAGIGVLGDMVLFSRVASHQRRDRVSIAQAAAERTRPVLMTALVTGLGLVPMAFHDGVGAEVIRPLATAVVGGVVTSTLATLILLPILLIRREEGQSAA